VTAWAILRNMRVGGLGDESGEPTQPVFVRCECGDGKWFTYRDDGGADRTEGLDELVAWAFSHECGRGGAP
jgi:hypothetical protein